LSVGHHLSPDSRLGPRTRSAGSPLRRFIVPPPSVLGNIPPPILCSDLRTVGGPNNQRKLCPMPLWFHNYCLVHARTIATRFRPSSAALRSPSQLARARSPRRPKSTSAGRTLGRVRAKLRVSPVTVSPANRRTTPPLTPPSRPTTNCPRTEPQSQFQSSSYRTKHRSLSARTPENSMATSQLGTIRWLTQPGL
jgi:hypothetical protein